MPLTKQSTLKTTISVRRKENFSIADNRPFALEIVSLFQDTASSPYAISCSDPTIAGYRSTNTSRASCHSTHLVRHKGLTLFFLTSGKPHSITSANLSCLFPYSKTLTLRSHYPSCCEQEVGNMNWQ